MLGLLIWLAVIPPTLALMVFSLEALMGVAALKSRPISTRMPTTRILVPAHNEAATIEMTLERLEALVSDSVRLLVVADNCSDETARLVSQAGHEVVERIDPDKRGKGYALAFGRDHLRRDPPECVIIFDADCEIDRASLEALAKSSVAQDSVFQARYIFKPDHPAPPKVQISNFAFWMKNVVRQRGAHRLGAAAVLTGTGMAFPWRIIENAPLATSEIVEDLALGIHLTRIGQPPVYLEQATVESMAATEQATLGQRTRWELGFIAVARTFGLKTLWEGIATGNRRLFQLGLHLLVPPLALLLMLSLLIALAVGLGAWITGRWEAFALLAAALTIASISVLLNWMLGGHRWLGFNALLRLPLYLIWKIPVYLRLAKGDKIDWTRTERAPELDSGKTE